jgi:hypothetical protein
MDDCSGCSSSWDSSMSDQSQSQHMHALQSGNQHRSVAVSSHTRSVFVCCFVRVSASGGSWSETGDRYLLSLFRDLVFHSVHSVDVPNLDWGHVINQLNKLDAGTAEKLLLSSRNGETMLLARYSDLKRCVEESYHELWRKQQEGTGGGHMRHAVAQRMPMGKSAPSVMRSMPMNK